jgi:GAF domain-containing protein
MVDHRQLHAALRDFAHTLVRGYAVGDVLYRLSDDITEVLGVAGSGVSLLDGDDLVFVTATSDAVEHIERLQDHFGEGPCEDAASQASPVAIEDLAGHCDRWPRLAPAAVELGLPSVLAIPMHVDGRTVGAVNIYAEDRRTWTDEEVDAAQLLADMATSYILMVDQLRSAEQLADQLQHALDSRVVIEQAKGMVARTHDIGIPAALERLRRHARNTNQRLHAVAAQVIAGDLMV